MDRRKLAVSNLIHTYYASIPVPCYAKPNRGNTQSQIEIAFLKLSNVDFISKAESKR